MKTIIDKANTRGYFNHGWLKTYHTFSFADYYNPRRIHFGALRVLNDDTVAPGEGFGMHPHKNMEVVSIPLQGYLRHGDNVQNESTITPGEIQVMSPCALTTYGPPPFWWSPSIPAPTWPSRSAAASSPLTPARPRGPKLSA